MPVRPVAAVVVWRRLPRRRRLSCSPAAAAAALARKRRAQAWRADLLRRAAARRAAAPLLAEFAARDVPAALEGAELAEMDALLRLDDDTLARLVANPGDPDARPFFARGNFTLERYLNFARFRAGTGEFR